MPGKINILSKQSPQETRALEYFHRKTLSSLFGFIETDLWTRLIPQLSEVEPAIKAAMSALGSFHELSEKYSFDKVFLKKTNDDALALQHYNRAITKLRARLSASPSSRTIALISCLLFTCLEFIRGDRTTALLHLKSGMNILRLQPCNIDGIAKGDIADESIAPIFSRISLLATIYGQPRESRYIDLLTIEEPEIVHEFTGLDQARASLINITNAVMGVAYYMDFSLFPSQLDADVARTSVIDSIKHWLDAFQPMLDNKDTNQSAAMLLKSSILLDRIWISRYGGVQNECAFDEYIGDFRDIIDSMEIVVEGFKERCCNHQSIPTFTIDTGVLLALYFTANKCRDRRLRRQAIGLMKRCPRREGVYDSVELSNVSEFIVEVEEEGLDPLPCADLPIEAKRVGDYVIENRSPDTNKQEVRLHHGFAWTPSNLLATRTFDYNQCIDGTEYSNS